ncbi:hypothetical protein ACHQM5_022770 [Ranunculus cassubicifolius]
MPNQSQENCKDSNNGEEEEGGEYCGSQNKEKKRGRGRPKRTPSLKTPISDQEASCGKIQKKQKKQDKDLKGVDMPEENVNSCIELESTPSKRSRRQSKKGKTDPSPRKVPTPKKLKGPHCRRIMSEFNADDGDLQREDVVIDLRLEAKLAAEENARLFMGKQTHPFFSSWKTGKKGTSESTELENKQSSKLDMDPSITCHPIHVFDMPQDDPVALDWSNWPLRDESSVDSICDPENACLSLFGSSTNALTLDHFSTTSDPYPPSFLSNENSLNPFISKLHPNLPPITLANGQEPLHQLENIQAVSFCLLFVYDCLDSRSSGYVCGNGEAVRFINEWLGSWRERYSRKSKNFAGDSTFVIDNGDYSADESYSDAESTEESAQLKNVLLVSGPVGSGKSAAIYACAREQGFHVIEVSASDWRHGAQIKQKFGAAMDSLGLNKWSLEDPLGSRMKNIPESPSGRPTKSSVVECPDDVIEVFPERCKEKSDSLKPDPDIIIIDDNLDSSSRGADKTLILFEDVDTIFEEDRGLIASIQQIAEIAKRPIMLTSNSKDTVLPDQLDRLEVCFTIPSPEDLFSHVSMVCAAEQAEIHPQLLHRFVECCQGDIRKTIMLLQFWCQGNMIEKGREFQSMYGLLHFDLEAGQRIIPKVIPWEFPCQLSELVEKEITKSLSLIKENISLLEIMEEDEEDHSFKETHNTLEIDMDAKKDAMLRMNSSTQFDNLEDFSNSTGSPVAFTRTARRGLHTVLSSQSEDEVDNNISKDSIDMSLKPCNVLQNSLAESMQNLFDCPPTEIHEHLFETYKSVDVSLVAESSFVPETEIESVSIVAASSLHDDNDSETILGKNTCEVDELPSPVHREEEIGDSQHENAESMTRRYQVMDECSRAGFNLASKGGIEQATSVSDTWRRLRCCNEDLKSHITAEKRNSCQILRLSSQLTDLLSVSDLMFSRCQPLTNELLEPPLVPYREPYSFSWYEDHLEMSSTIAQHGFCLFTNESIAKGSDSGFEVNRLNLSSEILTSSTNTTLLGKLITQNTISKKAPEISPMKSDVSLKKKTEAGFCDMIQNVVPPKMYLALKGGGDSFLDYVSSLGQISKFEATRLSKNIDKTNLRRRARVARHYLSTGSHTLTPEDATFLAQHSSFGKAEVE